MIERLLGTGFGYLLGVVTVTFIGVALVYRGLWGDRSKGRTRCPKCWYDMRGTVPRLECPECGHDAGYERRLHKHHRRWRRAVVGVVLVLLSAYALVIVGGWWREQSIAWSYGFVPDSSPTNTPVYGWPRRKVSTLEVVSPWLADRLPSELRGFFYRTYSLTINDSATLPVCQRLRYLRMVVVAGADVRDADLVHLQGLSNLNVLHLKLPQLTDAGLMHLKGLSNLEVLQLDGTQVTDAGLVHLKGLSRLQGLFLENTQVTDAGLVHLKGLNNLIELDLSGTQVTDAGLVHLKGLSNLRPVGLFDTQVTDAGEAEFNRPLRQDFDIMH